MKQLADHVLSFAATLLVAAFLLAWMWHVLRPLVPVLIVGAAVVGLANYLRSRRGYW